MNSCEYLIIHNTAVSREVNNAQFEATNNYHKDKGFPKSILGFYVGYHYMIIPSGKIIQARKDYEVGAHCKEKYMNWRSIGICLTGKFDIEEPTKEQLSALNNLVLRLMSFHKIKSKKVVGHRVFANKTCPGKNFTNGLINRMTMNEEEIKATDAIIAVNSALWSKLNDKGKEVVAETNKQLKKLLK